MATEKEPVAKVMPVQTGTTEVQKTKFDFRSLNTLSVVSLASALTGIGALMAIITGHIAQAQIKRSGENGRVLAVVGTVLGYVSIVSWIVVSILSVFFVALISEGMTGFQPGMFELHEFRRGFGDQ
jgi:peptidyl-prolyl cis-trans isomerase B (cyclophilin B)